MSRVAEDILMETDLPVTAEMITLDQASQRAGEWGVAVLPASLRDAVYRGKLRAVQVGPKTRGMWFTTEHWLRDYLDQRPEWGVRGGKLTAERRAARLREEEQGDEPGAGSDAR